MKLCRIGLFFWSYLIFFHLWFCPPDSIFACAGRGSGAGGDGTEVSAEWSVGRGALWSLRRANQSSAAGLPVIQPQLWFKRKPWYNKVQHVKTRGCSSSKWQQRRMEWVSPSSHREIWIRDLLADLPERHSGACALKAAAGEQRDGSDVYSLHRCIPAESSNLINRGQGLCFWSSLEDLHAMLLLVFVGFCSYMPTFYGPFHRFI